MKYFKDLIQTVDDLYKLIMNLLVMVVSRRHVGGLFVLYGW